MTRNYRSGGITVYLSIVLLVAALFIGNMVDGARVRIGEAQVKRAAESSVKSVLAGYDSSLKENYGIFVLGENTPEALGDELENYVNKNLMTELGVEAGNVGDELYDYIKKIIQGNGGYADARFLNMYDYRVEDMEVKPIFNLSENKVTRQQVLEYMKYRAPKELVDNFIEKLRKVEKAGAMSKASKKKLEVDKKAAKIDKKQAQLKVNVDKANRMAAGDKLESYINQVAQYRVKLKSIDLLKTKIRELEERIAGTQDEELKEKLKKERETLIENLEEEEDSADVLRDSRNNAFVQLTKYLTEFMDYNNLSLELIEDIKSLRKSIIPKIDDLSGFVDRELPEASDNPCSDFSKTLKDDLSGIRERLDGEKFEDLEESLKSNAKLLNDALAELQSFENQYGANTAGGPGYDSENPPDSTKEKEFIQSIIGNTGERLNTSYNTKMVYEYKTGQKGTDSDPRGSIASEADRAAQKEEPEKKTIEESIRKLLPSYEENGLFPNKVQSEGYSEDDNSGGTEDFTGTPDNDVEFDNDSDESEGFSEQGFGFMSAIGEKVKEMLLSARDEIYINEYIMGTCKHAVPALKRDKDKTDYDLRVRDKKERSAFFEDYEVEYILHGKSSETGNVKLVKGQILLTRFVLDTIHVYSDGKKRALTTQIAAAISGFWTGGLGIPIIENLLRCAWGMLEAVVDLDEIMKGGSVPVFKGEGDWRTDVRNIGGAKDAKDGNGLLSFSYHDYLRLFLLLQNSETKMNRIEDLIQLNMQQNNPGFRVSDYNTYLRVEATVSMKYMFISPSSIAGRVTGSGSSRHRFRIVLYQGY